jgi:hydrogenase maturation protein HypF
VTRIATPAPAVRLRVRVTGLVQGVGFRPHVHRLARSLGLAGHVGNDGAGVFAEVEGPGPATEAFLARLATEAPVAARIDGVEARPMAPTGQTGFAIAESSSVGAVRTFVSPDIATCPDCLAELFDPSDRRARYPFVNCTDCGPRFTITLRLPYDRPNTTMAGFAMCDECAAEYHDPRDRRFHAQPIACPACGPRLWFERDGSDGVTQRVHGSDEALAAAQAALARGEIVAVKGLGGYHLACDARSDEAVASLRARKHRAEKPFALMVRDLGEAAALAHVDRATADLLTSAERPIVLVERRDGAPLSALVAPGTPRLGLFLPYTPLHHLLFAPVPGATAESRPGSVPTALVMTSGNLTDEPICYEDADARRRLAGIADAWLLHDRPIHVPCDDSVAELEPGTGHALPLRRSRGYAPLPVRLPFAAAPTLAVGGELKNTFCLAAGDDAFVSQHIGDMGSLETWGAFGRAVEQLSCLYGIDAAQRAADAHPLYQTRRWAEEGSGPGVTGVATVQHHHAHVAALMAEHGVPADARVVGVAFDGTGFGSDGSIWGGEILVAGYGDFERVAHLRAVPLPGGDAAVRRPCRAALAHLWAAGIGWDDDLPPVAATTAAERDVVARQLERGVGCTMTSSMGRLFDAVSSLLGLRHVAGYEAQAAMELQWSAERWLRQGSAVPSYRFALADDAFDPAPVLRALVADVRAGLPAPAAAVGFHDAVAHLVAELAHREHERLGIDTVGLTGGVFQNVVLVGLVRHELEAHGLQVLTHRVVPPNDGGLALGQAAVAGYRAARAVRATSAMGS